MGKAWFDLSVLIDFAKVAESYRFWDRMRATQIFEIG